MNKFDYEHCETQEEVREHIQECEGLFDKLNH